MWKSIGSSRPIQHPIILNYKKKIQQNILNIKLPFGIIAYEAQRNALHEIKLTRKLVLNVCVWSVGFYTSTTSVLC